MANPAHHLWRDVLDFAKAVFHHWGATVSGVAFAVLGLANVFFSGNDTVDRGRVIHHDPFLPPWILWLACGLAVIAATFLAWRDTRQRYEDLASKESDRQSVDLQLSPRPHE